MLAAYSPALAFLAGILTILSPCVLPLIPIVFASAQGNHRWGAVALASGLAISFTSVGLLAATIGYSVGISTDMIRAAGSILLIGVAAVLLIPALQHQLEAVMAPVGNIAQRLMPNSQGGGSGWRQQFGIGTLLGIVWLPCVGPTLGAALVLASQGDRLAEVAFTMLAFGVGAALPLALIGTVSSKTSARRWLAMAGQRGKIALGATLAIAGLLILTGVDHRIEADLTAAAPEWLVSLTTRY
jgi:cytochrome c biogenesis protein CcdA